MDRIIKTSGLKARQVVNRLAFKVEGYAKMRAPVDTGALKNSGFTVVAARDGDAAIVGFSVEYAPYQEFGTYRMAAHPFLWPAVEQAATEFNDGKTWEEVVT
jgi:HK97 gp10 family phage protein